jgi:hypothetical protein
MFEKRVAYATAGEASREATGRLMEAELSPAALKVGAFLINQLASYSRLAEPVRVGQIADAIGLARETVSRALNRLAQLNVIGWRAGKARAKSWIALAHEYLPGRREASGGDAADPDGEHANVTTAVTSNVITPVTTERVVVNEKKTGERETALSGTSSVLNEVMDSSPYEEPLTPDETHDVDARFAAERLAMHLFNGLPDRWTCEQMYRRFKKLTIGSCTQVLQAALLGRPSQTVDCPHAYAVAWIATAERRVTYSAAA